MTSPPTSFKQRKYGKDIYNGVGGSIQMGSYDDDRCLSVSGDDEDANGDGGDDGGNVVSLPDSSVPSQRRAAALPSNTDGGVLMTSSPPRLTTCGDSDCDSDDESDGDSDFELENAIRYKKKIERTHADDNLSDDDDDDDNISDSETYSSDDEPAIVGYGERRRTRSRNVSDSPPLDIQDLLTGVVVDDCAPDDIDVRYTYNINNDLAYSKCTQKFQFPVYSKADQKVIMAIRKKCKKFVTIKDTVFVKNLISKYTDSKIFDCNHYPSRFPSKNLEESMTALKTLSKCLTDDLTNGKTIMVQRSALGAALSAYSANVEVVPTIFQRHTNHVKNARV
ncbi:clumping factor A-like [Aphis gossypii]|uniref:clumping factor A-like n=1 Tax=Aphis gossypii TaxID=80765 RepID=UPI0021593D98|nr:clumping factor A-like [Aphis gossypii]